MATQSSEENRQRVIRRKLCRMPEDSVVATLSSGLEAVDSALGIGGFPRGRIVEIFGCEGSGKTTLALWTIAATQRAGGNAALLDADHAFDARHAAGCGVLLGDLLFAQPDWSEQALEMTRQFAASGAVDLIVIDSAAALVPKVETEISLESFAAGLHGAVLGRNLRKIQAAAGRTNACILLLNQLRSSPGDSAESTAGGRVLKTWAALRCRLHPLGHERVHFQVVKNKFGLPAQTEFDIRFPRGRPAQLPDPLPNARQ
jgi:recombination protein RecA